MTALLVGVPVLGRPQNAAAVAANLREATPGAHIYFLCSLDDEAQQGACLDAMTKDDLLSVMPEPAGLGDFAKKHNTGYRTAVAGDYEWYFVGADDLVFHPGWFDRCLEAHRKAGACVIGTRDLGNPRTANGWHSTHFLVHRDYLECGTVDEPGKLLHEGYSHEFVDDEAVQTARARRTYATSQAVVEHLHPDWGKAEWDDTYRKAQSGRAADQALFHSRRHMWNGRRG